MKTAWQGYSDDTLMSIDECADIAGLSKGTIYKHRYAGLLPFVPGRPIMVQAGDFKVYMKLLSDGNIERLHRTLAITMEDRASYSTLSTVPDFRAKKTSEIIEEVISETQVIWERYKAQESGDHNGKHAKAVAAKKKKQRRLLAAE